MAEQGSGGVRRTLFWGSEEVFDVVCQPCGFENQQAEAKGFCLTCNQNLCSACIKVHKKIPALQNHVIEKKVRSPTDCSNKVIGSPATPVDTDPLTDKCQHHKQETVKFYCFTHQALGCGVCLLSDHKKCKDVAYIRNVSSGISSSDELKNIRSELGRIVSLMRYTSSKTAFTKQQIIEYCDLTIEQIDDFKGEIISYLNEVVHDLKEEAVNFKDQALKDVDETEASCDVLVKQVEHIDSEIDKRSKMGLNNDLYVSAKRAKAKLRDFREKANTLNGKAQSRVVFKREERFRDLILSRAPIGKVFLTDASTSRDVEYVRKINVSSHADRGRKSMVLGISAVSGGRIAVTDYQNKALKVINVKHGRIANEISTSSKPLGITTLEDDTVAITLNEERAIQVFSLTPFLSKSRDIQVHHLYKGIMHTSCGFILTPQSTEPDKSLHICDLSGTLTRRIETIMSVPWHLTLSPDRKVFYASDFKRNAVVCFDMDGKIISTYTHDKMKKPRGIVVDEYECVYVCSQATDTVHRWMLHGAKEGGPILTDKQKIRSPLAMAYSKDHLYIGGDDSNEIQVYRLI